MTRGALLVTRGALRRHRGQKTEIRTSGHPQPIQRPLVLRFQRFFPTVNLFDDGAGGCRPDKRLGVGVVVFEIIVDRSLEVDNGVEHAATDAFSGDLGEEALDHVEPGSRGRREVDVEARVFFQPPFDLRCLVGGVVIDDQVDVQVGQGLAVDPVQETNELLVAMALHALADDLAVEHVGHLLN